MNINYLNKKAIEEFLNIFKKTFSCKNLDKKYKKLCQAFLQNKSKIKNGLLPEFEFKKEKDKFIITDWDTFIIFEKNNIIYIMMKHNKIPIAIQKDLKNILNNNCEFKKGKSPYLTIKDIDKIIKLHIELANC
jgi:hypothetical protein